MDSQPFPGTLRQKRCIQICACLSRKPHRTPRLSLRRVG
jgi:hypothetical protein